MVWDIQYYKSQSGQKVIENFIDNLQESTQAKLARKLDLLEEHGSQLGMPHAKFMGSDLIRARIRKQMTQAEVAQKAGVSRTVVARLESGTTKPTLDTMNRVANTLGKELKLVGISR